MRFKGPPQGWAALRWEVGVVFLGIVLALCAQQIVDALYWQGQAARAKKKIEEELLEHERDLYSRRSAAPCLKNQIRLLADGLEANRGAWKAMPMIVFPQGLPNVADKVTPTAYRAPTWLWIDEAFKTAQATGVLNHLPDTLVADYAGVYRRSRRAIEIQDIEEEAANQLSVLAVDGQIDNDARPSLLAALARVDYASSYMETSLAAEAPILSRVLKHLPIERRRKNVEEAVEIQRKFRGSCVLPLKLET